MEGGKLIYMDIKCGGVSLGSLKGCTLPERREINVAAMAACKHLDPHICHCPYPHPETFRCPPAQQPAASPHTLTDSISAGSGL